MHSQFQVDQGSGILSVPVELHASAKVILFFDILNPDMVFLVIDRILHGSYAAVTSSRARRPAFTVDLSTDAASPRV
ncbi:unnamed protein product [Aphanomyces euteiches]|uniref:Uncharacterized protein n=1 Tax=Aphanomyces euteiches TaxID=100861 RepID=A0A6G0W6D9_9STRA|nr:hypothetical protein Ae201684_018507 [Aphanomyces euteiches]